MQHYYVPINLGLSAAVLAWMVGYLILRGWFAHDDSNYLMDWADGRAKLTGAGWGFTLWCLWWLSLVIIYIFLATSTNLFLLLLSSDLGNMMVLGAAIAYCRGSAFRLRSVVPLLLLAVLIPILETSLAKLLLGPAGRVVAIAPSAVISTAAMVAIGWAILVRCGWKSAPFFALMCVYACLQVPAFVYSMALDPEVQPYSFPVGSLEEFKHMRETYFGNLIGVFYVLAFLKVVVALSFLGYFLSPDHGGEGLKKEKTWPSDDVVQMHRGYFAALKYGATLVGSIIVGVVFQPLIAPIVKNWLGQ